LLSNVDLMPTLLEAAGIVPPAGIAGGSFLPALRGEAFAGREEIFGALTYHVQYLPQRCIRTRRHKYIRTYDSSALASLLPREVAADSVIVPEHRAGEALYDLSADPCERRDLVQRSDCAGLRRALSRQLDDWLDRTADPIRVGPVNKWEHRPYGHTWADCSSCSPGHKP
jgi:arylsulfatase A-like enzyme